MKKIRTTLLFSPAIILFAAIFNTYIESLNDPHGATNLITVHNPERRQMLHVFSPDGDICDFTAGDYNDPMPDKWEFTVTYSELPEGFNDELRYCIGPNYIPNDPSEYSGCIDVRLDQSLTPAPNTGGGYNLRLRADCYDATITPVPTTPVPTATATLRNPHHTLTPTPTQTPTQTPTPTATPNYVESIFLPVIR